MSLKGARQLQKLLDCRFPLMEDLVKKLHQDTRPTWSDYILNSYASSILRDYYLLYDKRSLCEDLRHLFTCCSLAKKTEEDYTFLFQVAGEIAVKLIESAADFQIHPDKVRLLESDVTYTELCFCVSCELLEMCFSLSEKKPNREIKSLRAKNRLAILAVIAPSCPELDTSKPRGLRRFLDFLN